MNLNRVIIAGNLCADPEVRATQSGMSVASLRLAINERARDGQERTVFVDVTAWDKTADFCRNYLSKGRSVLIEGRLKLDKWQDRETGRDRTKLAVTADRILFADSKPQGVGGGQQGPSGGYEGQEERGGYEEERGYEESGGEDDLPF